MDRPRVRIFRSKRSPIAPPPLQTSGNLLNRNSFKNFEGLSVEPQYGPAGGPNSVINQAGNFFAKIGGW